jgi:hypothetical protein
MPELGYGLFEQTALEHPFIQRPNVFWHGYLIKVSAFMTNC